VGRKRRGGGAAGLGSEAIAGIPDASHPETAGKGDLPSPIVNERVALLAIVEVYSISQHAVPP
jgi:hypothetical protein